MTAGDPQPAAPSHKSRWFCLTPDHNLAALLVVEGLLWLSERIGWPTWPKGYAVLTAVAAAALALLLLLVWFAVALLFRWRFQFSTRSLLVLTVAVAIPCSWLAVERKKAREQQQVVATIEKQLRGSVAYDWEYDVDGAWLPNARPPGPSWLRDLLGEDFFRAVVRVNLSDEKVTDAALEQLKGLGQLRKLWLEHTKVTDAGLERLRGLRQLQELSLRGTEVTGTGLENLKGLGQLQWLSLSDAPVTDAGLEHVEGLTQLRWLQLDGTQVTDAGLEHLKRLVALDYVMLQRTQVPDPGPSVEKLRKALPNCTVNLELPPPDAPHTWAAPDQPGG